MPPADLNQENEVPPLGGPRLKKVIFGVLSLMAVYIHIPLVILIWGKYSHDNSIVIIAAVFTFLLAAQFQVGVAALIDGSSKPHVATLIKRGSRTAWILAALTPLSLYATIWNPDLEYREMWMTVFPLGVAALYLYIRQARRYRTHVQSVA